MFFQRSALSTAVGVTLAVAVPCALLLGNWNVLSACPQPPDDVPDGLIAAVLWTMLGSPVIGAVVGAVVARRRDRSDDEPAD